MSSWERNYESRPSSYRGGEDRRQRHEGDDRDAGWRAVGGRGGEGGGDRRYHRHNNAWNERYGRGRNSGNGYSGWHPRDRSRDRHDNRERDCPWESASTEGSGWSPPPRGHRRDYCGERVGGVEKERDRDGGHSRDYYPRDQPPPRREDGGRDGGNAGYHGGGRTGERLRHHQHQHHHQRSRARDEEPSNKRFRGEEGHPRVDAGVPPRPNNNDNNNTSGATLSPRRDRHRRVTGDRVDVRAGSGGEDGRGRSRGEDIEGADDFFALDDDDRRGGCTSDAEEADAVDDDVGGGKNDVGGGERRRNIPLARDRPTGGPGRVVAPRAQETDLHRLKTRLKQVEFGYNTLGYARYLELVPKNKRGNDRNRYPRTPDPYQVCSKRSYDGQIRKWRRLLHAYDPPEEDDEEVVARPVVPEARLNARLDREA